ncbi:MAG: hypothetical protein JWP27_1346 [Flaviaesturariibacter sp.]|nr:hypothetical protein [Flaviaesturariibacter sp.]
MKKILTTLSILTLLACNNEASTAPASADGTSVADTVPAQPAIIDDTVRPAAPDTMPVVAPAATKPSSQVKATAGKGVAAKPVKKDAHIDKKALKDASDSARQ